MGVPLLDGMVADLAIATPHDNDNGEITLTGAWPSSVLSPLAVDDCAVASVAACLSAAADLAVARGVKRPHVELDRGHVAAVMRSEAWLRDPRSGTQNERMHELLGQADVLVTGYRPGALRRFGLDPDQVAERHPGVSVVTLSAWGTTSPWGSRRGFDSLVQIVSGVGWATSTDGERPGALPFQLLDHGTGYLIAAAALAALSHRGRTHETTHADLSLAATAHWLLQQGIRPSAAEPPSASESDVVDFRMPLGDGWSGIAPPGRVDGRALGWPRLPPRYGRAQPSWV